MRLSCFNGVTDIKVYQTSPVWQLDKELATVDLTEAENVELHECKNGNVVLKVDEGDGRMILIGFKRGTAIQDDGSYTIGRFVAERDFDQDNVHIKKGDVKYMAY